MKPRMSRLEHELELANTLLAPSKLSVERWAPGDGRARYRLICDGWESGPYIMGRGNMISALTMMNAALSRATRDRTQDLTI